ncbi:hypothetical protein J2W18_000435 [Rhodococcus cercidiphylli]|nr:hypothetical protein [Rhodococcus cercidiphylli]
MDAKEVLKEAWDAVKHSGVPEELYEAAFMRAVDLVGGSESPPRTAPTTIPTPHPAGPVATPSSTDVKTGTDEELYAKLFEVTKVPIEKLERYLHLEEGVPRLALNSKQLPTGKKAARIFIAKVVLAVRNLYLGEGEVQVSDIRTECDHYGLADSNFSTDIKGLNANGLMPSTDGKRIKVRRTFTDTFDEILDSVPISE